MDAMDAMEDERSQVLAQFTDITGVEEGPALQYLEATDWRLEEAIQFFFANDVEPFEPAAANAPIPEPPAIEHDAAVQAYGRLPAAEEDEDDVRPPLPVTREALYDNVYAQRAAMQAAQPPPGPAAMNPFRDFQAELNARMQQPAVVPSAAVPPHVGRNRTLDHMYQPPYDIIYHGSFEQAKAIAMQQKRWLLINVQNDLEFATHQLNSLTWSQEAVKQTISQNFIFWQVDISNEEGQKVQTYYHLEIAPVIMVLDPQTGAKKKIWEGMVDSQRLLEDLVPFMDKGPMDVRIGPPPSASGSKRLQEDEGPPPPVAGDGVTSDFGDEEEELQRALAASMETYQGQSSGAREEREPQLPGSSGGTASAALASEPPPPRPEKKKAEFPPLPAEPSTSDPGSCRVGIRFPDGSRATRYFLKSDPLEYLWRYCAEKVPEAAEGRAFRLSLPMPGALPLELSPGATIDSAGVSDAMLAFTWE